MGLRGSRPDGHRRIGGHRGAGFADAHSVVAAAGTPDDTAIPSALDSVDGDGLYASFRVAQGIGPRPGRLAALTEPLTVAEGTVSEKIKASVTVLEFVSQYVDLKPTASGAIGLCPFHDDHHPSFGVNEAGNYWHCFAGCGGGSVIDLWTKLRGCDFTTAVRELAEMLL